jgi:hypothetical protein
MNHLKKTGLTGLLVMCFYTNYAQNCNGLGIDTLHGKWKVFLDGTILNKSRPELVREKILLEGLNEIVRKNWAWEPLGGNLMYGSYLIYSGYHRPDPVVKISDEYNTSIGFRKFTCDHGKIVDEPWDGALQITFNELPFTFDLNLFAPGPKDTINELPAIDVYATLYRLPEVKDGYFDYTKDPKDRYSNYGAGRYRYRTITKPGKLPYLLMSKKAYYEKWKIKHQTEIKNSQSRTKELVGNAQMGDIIKLSNQLEAIYQHYIDKIDKLLKTKSAEELSQPAFQGKEEGEYYESIEATPYKAYIVIPNYDYYNYKLNNKAAAQVITITLEYDNEVFNNAMGKKKDFDLLTEKLKPLIVQ